MNDLYVHVLKISLRKYFSQVHVINKLSADRSGKCYYTFIYTLVHCMRL